MPRGLELCQVCMSQPFIINLSKWTFQHSNTDLSEKDIVNLEKSITIHNFQLTSQSFYGQQLKKK